MSLDEWPIVCLIRCRMGDASALPKLFLYESAGSRFLPPIY